MSSSSAAWNTVISLCGTASAGNNFCMALLQLGIISAWCGTAAARNNFTAWHHWSWKNHDFRPIL